MGQEFNKGLARHSSLLPKASANMILLKLEDPFPKWLSGRKSPGSVGQRPQFLSNESLHSATWDSSLSGNWVPRVYEFHKNWKALFSLNLKSQRVTSTRIQLVKHVTKANTDSRKEQITPPITGGMVKNFWSSWIYYTHKMFNIITTIFCELLQSLELLLSQT